MLYNRVKQQVRFFYYNHQENIFVFVYDKVKLIIKQGTIKIYKS